MELCNFDRALERIKYGAIPKKRGFIVNALEKRRFCFCTMFEDSANMFLLIRVNYCRGCRGRDSSVGIATGYGLDGQGSNPGRGEIFRTSPDRPEGPPSLLYNGYRVFPWGKAAGAWC
jgi:hypothetical protein